MTDSFPSTKQPFDFSSSWLEHELRTWKYLEEQKKADFMEHMYECSGRSDPEHPMHGLYTGLWINFCLKEAGPFARNKWFDMKEAVKLFEKGALEPVPFIVV